MVENKETNFRKRKKWNPVLVEKEKTFESKRVLTALTFRTQDYFYCPSKRLSWGRSCSTEVEHLPHDPEVIIDGHFLFIKSLNESAVVVVVV